MDVFYNMLVTTRKWDRAIVAHKVAGPEQILRAYLLNAHENRPKMELA